MSKQRNDKGAGVKTGLSHVGPVGQKTPRGHGPQGQRPKPERDGRFKY